MLAVLGTAGLLSIELSYVPQIARLHRLKQADDVSVFFPALNLFGRLLALTYSIGIGQPIFGVGFFVGAVLRATLLVQVVYYRFLRRAAPLEGETLPKVATT